MTTVSDGEETTTQPQLTMTSADYDGVTNFELLDQTGDHEMLETNETDSNFMSTNALDNESEGSIQKQQLLLEDTNTTAPEATLSYTSVAETIPVSFNTSEATSDVSESNVSTPNTHQQLSTMQITTLEIISTTPDPPTTFTAQHDENGNLRKHVDATSDSITFAPPTSVTSESTTGLTSPSSIATPSPQVKLSTGFASTTPLSTISTSTHTTTSTTPESPKTTVELILTTSKTTENPLTTFSSATSAMPLDETTQARTTSMHTTLSTTTTPATTLSTTTITQASTSASTTFTPSTSPSSTPRPSTPVTTEEYVKSAAMPLPPPQPFIARAPPRTSTASSTTPDDKDMKNYDSSHHTLWETMMICRNIRSGRVLQEALRSMRGHHMNFLIFDNVKMPTPFPFALFSQFSFDFLEFINITSMQFTSFPTRSECFN